MLEIPTMLNKIKNEVLKIKLETANLDKWKPIQNQYFVTTNALHFVILVKKTDFVMVTESPF